MKKSVYSLLLSDELMARLDGMARQQGLSRSGLVNRILSEHIALPIPEVHMEQVIRSIMSVAGEGRLQPLGEPSGSLLQIRGTLRYKYNPAIRYTVELQPEENAYKGVFRAISRSQSDALLQMLEYFFRVWMAVEDTCLQKSYPITQEVAPGRYTRWLHIRREAKPDPQWLGESIGRYVQLFDHCQEIFFSTGGTDPMALQAMIQLYDDFLKETKMLL